MDILQVDQISFSYNGLTVLSDVRFGVEKGDFLGLIGPNGSGKTTLLKLIDGLLQPDRGSIRLNGTPIRKMKRNDLAKIIAVVPQAAPSIFPFTVREVVLMGRTPHLGRWRLKGRRTWRQWKEP